MGTEGPCFTCCSRRVIPGDCHIACVNPPKTLLVVGCCGKGMLGTFDKFGAPNFDSVVHRLLYAKKVAEQKQAVVTCIWPGCGSFPFCFDPLIVVACVNAKLEKTKKKEE